MVDSISKAAVSAELAAAVVRDAFGHHAELAMMAECPEGWFNAAHVLTLGDGRRCVLKVAPPPEVTVLTYERDIMATEVAALRMIGERTALPVPEVLWHDTSCRRAPSELFLMSFMPGRLLSELRPTLSTDQQRTVDAQLAHHLRAMNALTHQSFGLQAPSAARFARWSDAFIRLIDDLLDDGEHADVPLPAAPDRIRTMVRAHAHELDEVTVPSFVHWDLWDTNVFVDPESLEVTGLIDFERALWADPLMEGQFLYRRDDNAFVEAYGVPLMDAPGAAVRRTLYDMYLFLVMVIEATYRQYPTDDIERSGRTRLVGTLPLLGLGGNVNT
jgi:aminoglycoside phosphotransferase (APT) family kinase protein